MSKCACVHFGYSEFCAHVGVDTHVGTSTGGGSLQHPEQNLSLGLPPASVQNYWHHHSWIYFFFFFFQEKHPFRSPSSHAHPSLTQDHHDPGRGGEWGLTLAGMCLTNHVPWLPAVLPGGRLFIIHSNLLDGLAQLCILPPSLLSYLKGSLGRI